MDELANTNITNKLDAKKEEVVENYIKAFGIVSVACKASGISRYTFYEWLKKYPEFKEAIENSNAKEAKKDFIENALIQLINNKETSAVIFAAKTQLKDRGYIERTEVEHQGKVALSFTENLKDV